MSILIKCMEMPETCRDCRLSTVIAFDKRPLCDALVQYMSYGEWEAKRLDNCPLVPVPPHGRLIDADALAEYVHQQDDWLSETAIHAFCGILCKAPTVIPAEEDET